MSEAERETIHWSTYLFVIGAGVFGLLSMLHFHRYGAGGAFPSEIHLVTAVTFFLIGVTFLVYIDVAELSWRTQLWACVMAVCKFVQGGVFTFSLTAFGSDLDWIEFIFTILTGLVSVFAYFGAGWIHRRWTPD